MDGELIAFLINAKKAAYAGGGAESPAARPGSRELRYSEGTFDYVDAYMGSSKFVGEEAVWVNGVPVWAMNYIGRTLSDSFSGDFLKEALLLVTEEAPYRGPEEYKRGEYAYKRSVKGNVGWFYGYEEIFYESKKVYECAFHGGDVG